jgi:hypothetical protein
MDRKGHPLPASDESRHGEIPEDKIEEKGFGDDSAELVQPADAPVNPDGEPYRYDDNGRAENIETGEGDTPESLGPGTPA